jgi:peptide subunit release factor RF-3
VATDIDGDHVFLAASVFNLSWTQDKNLEIAFADIKAIDKI